MYTFAIFTTFFPNRFLPIVYHAIRANHKRYTDSPGRCESTVHIVAHCETQTGLLVLSAKQPRPNRLT